MLTKRELRAQMRRHGAVLSSSQRAVSSLAACREVLKSVQWQRARTVMLYRALPDEADVQPLVHAAWREGKRVLLPVVRGDGEMAVRLVEPSTPLRSGAYGIMEPVGDDFTDYGQIDLIIVPGMAFDAEGRRLGRGKGYYDRFLPRVPNAYRLGVCFPYQFVDAVPVGSHDRRMDGVIHSFKPN